MERQSKEASLRRDADFSVRTLAEDYVAITPLGQVTTKQETITARRSGQLRYEAMNVTDMVVRVLAIPPWSPPAPTSKATSWAKSSADPIATPASGSAATDTGKPSVIRQPSRSEQRPAPGSMPRMIRMALENGERPVDLLQQNHASQFVGQRHRAQ